MTWEGYRLPPHEDTGAEPPSLLEQEIAEAEMRDQQMQAIADIYGVPYAMIATPTSPPDVVERTGVDPRTLGDLPNCSNCSSGSGAACTWCKYPRCPECKSPLCLDWCSFCDAVDWQATCVDEAALPDTHPGTA